MNHSQNNTNVIFLTFGISPQFFFCNQPLIKRLKGLLYLENSEIIADSYISDPEKLTQIILDCSVYGVRGVLKLGKETAMNIERLSRNLCYALHKRRSELLCLHTKHSV